MQKILYVHCCMIIKEEREIIGLIRDLEHSDCKFFFQEETQPKIEPAIRSQAFPAVF